MNGGIDTPPLIALFLPLIEKKSPKQERCAYCFISSMKHSSLMVVFILLLGLSLGYGQQKRPRPEKVRDVVCGLMVEKNPELSAAYKGQTYYFCTKRDRDEFKKNPQKYVKDK
jgi:YHS domain-containing protein